MYDLLIVLLLLCGAVLLCVVNLNAEVHKDDEF